MTVAVTVAETKLCKG